MSHCKKSRSPCRPSSFKIGMAVISLSPKIVRYRKFAKKDRTLFAWEKPTNLQRADLPNPSLAGNVPFVESAVSSSLKENLFILSHKNGVYSTPRISANMSMGCPFKPIDIQNNFP